MTTNGNRQPDKRRLNATSTLEWVAGMAKAKESPRQSGVSYMDYEEGVKI